MFNAIAIFRNDFIEIKAPSLLGMFPKLKKATAGFVMSVLLSIRLSVCPHGTTLPQLDGCLLDLMFEYF
jgi:hypothetical protein